MIKIAFLSEKSGDSLLDTERVAHQSVSHLCPKGVPLKSVTCWSNYVGRNRWRGYWTSHGIPVIVFPYRNIMLYTQVVQNATCYNNHGCSFWWAEDHPTTSIQTSEINKVSLWTKLFFHCYVNFDRNIYHYSYIGFIQKHKHIFPISHLNLFLRTPKALSIVALVATWLLL